MSVIDPQLPDTDAVSDALLALFGDAPPDPVDLARVRDYCRTGFARQIRQSRHVSLRELAAAVGDTTPTSVHRWETGQCAPRGLAAARYVMVLDRLVERS